MTPAQTTKTALLEAAYKLFIERGYDAVSTRDITNAAKANLASIPYYFGSKAELFVETVKYTVGQDCTMKRAFSTTEISCDGPQNCEETLRQLIHHFIGVLLDSDRQSICWVMHREILNRAPETQDMRKQLIEFFFTNVTKPLSNSIVELVRGINGNLSLPVAKKISDSIVAQCTFFATHEAFIEFDIGNSTRTQSFIDESSAHVFNFSVTAIKNFNG